MTKWTDIFGSFEDHAHDLPKLSDVNAPVRVLYADEGHRQLTVQEAYDYAQDFALEVLTAAGYNSPSEHDDFHQPAEDLLQGILHELFVRDVRMARMISQALNFARNERGMLVEPRIHTTECELHLKLDEWPFAKVCRAETVDTIEINDEKLAVCHWHWLEYVEHMHDQHKRISEALARAAEEA